MTADQLAALQSGMNARLAQLQSAYNAAGTEAEGLVAQAMLSQTDVDSVLMQTGSSIALLGGDLYQAVLGNHPFPLDGSSIDQAGAASTWDNLSQDVQTTLVASLHYEGDFGTAWSAAGTLASMAVNAALPVIKPIVEGGLGILAVVGLVLFGPELFGAARTAKAMAGTKARKWSGYRAARRKSKPRRYW